MIIIIIIKDVTSDWTSSTVIHLHVVLVAAFRLKRVRWCQKLASLPFLFLISFTCTCMHDGIRVCKLTISLILPHLFHILLIIVSPKSGDVLRQTGSVQVP